MATDSHLPIAETPEQLTPDWLTEALRRGGHLDDGRHVTAVERSPVGTGQMCDSLRLGLTYDGPTDAPRSLVAKLPAADETSRATALTLRSYENEVRFYQELAADLAVRTPVALHADIDVTSAAFVLLLEDLAPGRPGDQLAGCSEEEAQLAVAELVKLHAPRWADPGLDEVEWLHRDPATNRQFLAMLLPVLWDGFRERYGGELDPDVERAGAGLFSDLDGYLGSDSAPWSIVHGDYRLDNLLFDPTPGGTPIAVVDWQTCTHGPPVTDVAYFLGAGLTPDRRRAVEEDLVAEYHAALVAAGVADYDHDRCWRDYRRGTWAGLIMAVAASMLVARTDRGDQMFLTMAARHSRHALDLDALEVIRR